MLFRYFFLLFFQRGLGPDADNDPSFFSSCNNYNNNIKVLYAKPSNKVYLLLANEAEVAQSVSARPSELESRQFDPHHSIDVCFDIPLFRVVEALNTLDRGRGGKRSALRATSLSV